MGTHKRLQKFALGILGAAFIFTPTTVDAQGLPDLVITTDSRIPLQGSCERDSPLWKGVIAIKNIGDADAAFGGGGGLTDGSILDSSKPENVILSVYVPQNIDIKQEEGLQRALRPLDQRGFGISIGEGRLKKCRFFSKPPTIRQSDGRYSSTYGYGYGGDRRQVSTNLYDGSVRALQRALMAKGYELPKFGDDGDYGGETEAALRDYFADTGGALPSDISDRPISRATINDILSKLGATSTNQNRKACTSGARGSREQVTIYAVVDPGDEIAEHDEANNSATFTVNIDCSNVKN